MGVVTAIAAGPAEPRTGPYDSATFLVLFRCEPAAWRDLFPREPRARVGRLAPRGFLVPRLRGHLAELARADSSGFRYAAAAELYGAGNVAPLATEGGTGLLIRSECWGERTELAVCEMRRGRAVRHVATRSLAADQVLVLGIEFAGEPCVAVIRAENIHTAGNRGFPAGFEARRDGLRRSMADAETSWVLGIRDLPPEADRCLDSR